MKSSRIMWMSVVLVVSATMAIAFGTFDSSGQEICKNQAEPTPTTASPFGDLSKYPTVDYDAPEIITAPEREMRTIKNRRYDAVLDVLKNPIPDTTAEIASDVEPEPLAIPISESKLIVTGEITNAKAFLSNERKGVYSEYDFRIQTILKADKQKLRSGENIGIDRAGGVVRYPSGQKVLYLIDWQQLPSSGNRYLFFLAKEESDNPNYKIITGYQLADKKVIALDNLAIFREFNGKNEGEFIKLVTSKD
jgi:hypothetical protein